MRLRTKLMLVCSLATAGVSASVGSAAIIATANAAISKVDSNLNALALNSCSSQDPVGAALLALDTIGPDTEIGFYSINGDYSTLSDGIGVITRAPTATQLRHSSKSVQNIAQAEGESYRLKTCSMPDREFVVFATSLKEVNQATSKNIALSTSVMLAAILAGAALIWLLTRKDIRRIENLIAKAQGIAKGNFDTELEMVPQRSELDALNNSLSQMLKALTAALAAEVESKQQSKDFLADASHELKTPLTLIRGYFELLEREPQLEPEVSERSRARIHEQILRMQSLISDMLLLAELEQNQPLIFQAVNLSKIVESAVHDLKTLHPSRDVEATIEPELYIFGSISLIEQLTSNLVSNLSRHTSDSDTAKISARRIVDAVVLTVDDSGAGLPEEAYEKGVKYFSRFDSSRSRSSGGSGLGISIMSAIVSKHAGEFSLQRSSLGGLCTRVVFASVSRIS